jgi:RNA polymerase sigma factor (sigma-70 family)
MDDQRRRGKGKSATEELILRTVAAHADSLLRTARRHSICVDDAQDAYQRALEIFMTSADRLDAAHAAGWLHVVVKHEAQAIRRSRAKLVGSADVDLDAQEARRLPSPDEQLLSFDMVSRSAEALQRLKPQELRALWLKAQGHSYNEIAALTGWSYTKVNRCLTEGRRNFLERYAGIESGAECERWMPVISAMVDGEATPDQVLDLRPHLRNCPGCRATLKALKDSSAPLSAVLPVPLVVVATGTSEHLSNLVLRAYEAVSGGLHERAVHSVTKAQAALEAAAAGKVAAVAASAAAVAGGGYATVERTVGQEPPGVRHTTAQRQASTPVRPSWRTPTMRSAQGPTTTRRVTPVAKPAKPRSKQPRQEFKPSARKSRQVAPEFEQPVARRISASTASAAPRPARRPPSALTAPEFTDSSGGKSAPEFGP